VEQLLADLKAPEEFAVEIFARHPDINYPTCICATPDGELFVGCDGNSAQGTAPNRGRVVLCKAKSGGAADTFTEFCKVDHPRGLLYLNGALYVNHPGDFSVFYDDDGDGKADREEILVKNIASYNAYTRRGADHSTNNITMGIDGWIYFAVGDQGMNDAVATKDGARLQMRGGIARIRPDGTGLERVVWGTRNIYGVAIDPYMNLFSRDNTNDGGGWNVRLTHDIPTAQYGYPSLFINFSDEIMKPLVDYGGGGPTGAIYLDEPLLPEPYQNALYTVDYSRKSVYRHVLEPQGATFKAGTKQIEFLRCANPINLEYDGMGRLYVSSFFGSGFNYSGENTGYVARLTRKDVQPIVYPNLQNAADTDLVRFLTGASGHFRIHAQREIVCRGEKGQSTMALESAAADANVALAGRVAALFTLKQLRGDKSHPALVRLAEDPNLREFALRALVDDKRDLAGVPLPLFVDGLKDSDPRVRLQAVIGIGRLGKKELAKDLIPLLSDPDPAIAHVTYRNLWILGAADACLGALNPSSSPEGILGSTCALQLMHEPAVVSGLIQKLNDVPDVRIQQAAIRALARLYFDEKEWDGTWWGTHPSTVGPYFQGIKWSESDRIAKALNDVAVKAEGPLLAALVTEANRSHVPLIDKNELTFKLAETDARFRAQAVELLTRERDFNAGSIALLQKIVQDESNALALRSRALRCLSVGSFTLKDLDPFVATVASLGSKELPKEVATVRNEIIRDGQQVNFLDYYAKVASGPEARRRRFAFAVLVQVNCNSQLPVGPRNESAKAIEMGWSKPETTVSLLQAIGDLQAEEFALQIKSFVKDARADVRQAAQDAATAVDLDRLERPQGPTIGSMKYDDVLGAAVNEMGDVQRGARLFNKQGCILCHAVNAGEMPKGPDLTEIGSKQKREELLESILKPSARLAQGFEPWLFILDDGRSINGFIVRETGEEIDVRNASGITTTIAKPQIDERVRVTISNMPEGLVNALSVQDLSSLLAYLESLKTKE